MSVLRTSSYAVEESDWWRGHVERSRGQLKYFEQKPTNAGDFKLIHLSLAAVLSERVRAHQERYALST